jgi:hypothetical protein
VAAHANILTFLHLLNLPHLPYLPYLPLQIIMDQRLHGMEHSNIRLILTTDSAPSPEPPSISDNRSQKEQ